MNSGIVYVAWGDAYVTEAIVSAKTVLANGGHPCALITKAPLSGPHPFAQVLIEPLEGSYRDKILMRKSPFAKTIFLDTDTRVIQPIDDIFRLLDRFDLAFQSTNSGFHYSLPGVPMEGLTEPSAGIVAWRNNARTQAFFDLWDKSYQEQQEQNGDGAWDQRSMRKAIWDSDVSIIGLSPNWQVYTWDATMLVGSAKIIHGRRWMDAVSSSANNRLDHRVYLPAIGFHKVFGAGPFDYFGLALSAFLAGMRRLIRLALHYSGLKPLPVNSRPM